MNELCDNLLFDKKKEQKKKKKKKKKQERIKTMKEIVYYRWYKVQ